MSEGIPIRPNQVKDVLFKDTMPEDVYFAIIDAFNALINEKYNSRTVSSRFTLTEVRNKVSLPTEIEVKLEWFDVKDVYRDQGWKVQYTKAGLNDSFESFFVFSKMKK